MSELEKPLLIIKAGYQLSLLHLGKQLKIELVHDYEGVHSVLLPSTEIKRIIKWLNHEYNR